MNIWKYEKVKSISADDLLTVLGAVGAAMAAGAGAAAAPSDSREGIALVIVAGIGAAATAGVTAYFRFRKAA